MYFIFFIFTLRYPIVFSDVHPVCCCCCCCISGNYGSTLLCNDDDCNNKNSKPVLWKPCVCVVTKRYDVYRRPGNRLLLGRSFDFRFRAERNAKIVVRVTTDTARNASLSFPSKRIVHVCTLDF